jgi:hypothetical protein
MCPPCAVAAVVSLHLTAKWLHLTPELHGYLISLVSRPISGL